MKLMTEALEKKTSQILCTPYLHTIITLITYHIHSMRRRCNCNVIVFHLQLHFDQIPFYFYSLLSSLISQLFIIDHNQVDWRIAMTSHRIIVITLELLVCVIHPVGSYWGVALHVNSSSIVPTPSPLCVSSHHGEALMDMELLLSVLMFLRLYLVHRAILLHSKVLLSASYRSIGSLNNINFTFRFVLKVLMNKHPARMLLVFILFFWLTVSWMLTLCERYEAQLRLCVIKLIQNRIKLIFHLHECRHYNRKIS